MASNAVLVQLLKYLRDSGALTHEETNSVLDNTKSDLIAEAPRPTSVSTRMTLSSADGNKTVVLPPLRSELVGQNSRKSPQVAAWRMERP
jgi:hypothetical protein